MTAGRSVIEYGVLYLESDVSVEVYFTMKKDTITVTELCVIASYQIVGSILERTNNYHRNTSRNRELYILSQYGVLCSIPQSRRRAQPLADPLIRVQHFSVIPNLVTL